MPNLNMNAPYFFEKPVSSHLAKQCQAHEHFSLNPVVILHQMYGVIKPGCVPEMGVGMFFSWSKLITCVFDMLQVCRRNSSTLGRES